MFAEDALKPIFDDVFHKTKNYTMQRSRFEKLDHFYSLCDSKSSVIDIGVSANEYNEYVNLFQSNFRLNSRQYTGLSIEPMDGIRENIQISDFSNMGET